jgi:hypothetical protein
VTLQIEVDDKAPVYLHVMKGQGFNRKSPLCRNNNSLGLSVLATPEDKDALMASFGMLSMNVSFGMCDKKSHE